MAVISAADGISDGFETSITEPSPLVMWYSTDGAVEISDRPNSRSRRSRTISMWSRPRKPHRKPKPSAPDVSGSKVNELSLSRSFSNASRRSVN